MRNYDGSLCGNYICGWLTEDNKIEETKVASWWAEIQFGVVALAYAQQKAYQRATTKVVKDNKGKISQMAGFLDVEERGVTIEMDNTPIHSLSYLPSYNLRTGMIYEKDAYGDFVLDKKGNKKKIKTTDRPLKNVPAKWLGYSKATNKTIELPEDFVIDNFEPGFVANLRHNARKSNGTFIEIPPGDNRQHEPQENKDKVPKLFYRQKEDEKTCLMVLVANLLHECGSQEHASFLVND